jgi:drug/metabolite transporter (DMT)-like permease
LGLVFFGGLANLAFATAIVLGDVLRVMVLFYLLPAWGVLGGRWILGERIDAQRWASLVLALTGAVLVLGGLSVLYAIPSWVDWVAIGSGMTLAANNIIFRRTQGVPVPIKVGANFVGCLLWAGVLTALGFADVPHDVPGVIWVQLVMFGVVWILVATLGTLWGVHHMEAGRSSVLIIMELVTAVGSSCLLTGRKPSAVEWLGGGCILLSAVLEAWRTPNALRAPVG